MKTYDLVVCGGTFDHFHRGHQEFLQFVLSRSRKIVLGLTSDRYTKHTKIINSVESYAQRKLALQKFLRTQKAPDRAQIASIDNLFIPKKWDQLPIEAIIVSANTAKGAEYINQDRKKRGLPTLDIVEVPLTLGEDGQVISSSRIRKGTINRSGRSYVKPAWLANDLLLPEDLRVRLQEPFGKVYEDIRQIKKSKFIITVGDVTTIAANENSLNQRISVIDLAVSRKKIYASLFDVGFTGTQEVIKVDNPRSTITSKLFKALINIFNILNSDKSFVVQVNGEEDLAVAPIVLIAPLGYTILYGQPGLGVVVIEVTEKKKEEIYKLLSAFKLASE